MTGVFIIIIIIIIIIVVTPLTVELSKNASFSSFLST